MSSQEIVKELKVFALATDPIYIGTGGYTIGRVDNTIVRDPITNVPKIPGSSLAGTWRYYVALELHKYFKDEFRIDKDKRKKELDTILSQKNKNEWKDLSEDERQEFLQQIFNSNYKWVLFEGNRFAGIKCAGQDDVPNEELNQELSNNKTGHCGQCIVCKGFGFSKKDISWQGQIYFSDLNILFFPVFTMEGTKWITTASKLKEIGIDTSEPKDNKIKIKQSESNSDKKYSNLGWLYLEIEEGDHTIEKLETKDFELKPQDIVIVPESLFSHIVNSNLEVRTSVSIDPITGAAKEGALFTSEAIPRGTIFYGNIRIFDKSLFGNMNDKDKLKPIPTIDDLICALCSSKHFYETLGIGGMTTRGFGRLKINLADSTKEDKSKKQNDSQDSQDESSKGGA